MAYKQPVSLKICLISTAPISLSKKVLVQRKPADGKVAITSQLGLAGKTCNLIKGSPAVMRIKNLGNEIGDTIFISKRLINTERNNRRWLNTVTLIMPYAMKI